MSTPFTLPHPQVATAGYHSRLLFHWRADRMRTRALGGEDATLVRAATATIEDSEGVSRVVGHHQSRWTSVDTDGDSVRDAPALFLSRDDTEVFSWPFLARPQALTAYVRFLEGGTSGLANARVLHIGSAVGAGPYLRVLSTGSFYRAEHHNGTVAVNATLAAVPTSGQRVELRVVLLASGAVAIGQSINEAAETTATSGVPGGGPALASAWSGALLWMNGEAAASAGVGYYRALKIAAGVRTLADCRGRVF